MNITEILAKRGFTESLQAYTDYEQMAELEANSKSWHRNANTMLVAAKITSESDEYEMLGAAYEISDHPSAFISINNKDILEGMLLAIGVEDLQPLMTAIATYAQSPLSKRIGIWRQFLIEDQIRYLETLLQLKHPKHVEKQFMLNPQARRGIIQLQRLFNMLPFLQLDFGLVPQKDQYMRFHLLAGRQQLEGGRSIASRCIGFRLIRQ